LLDSFSFGFETIKVLVVNLNLANDAQKWRSNVKRSVEGRRKNGLIKKD